MIADYKDSLATYGTGFYRNLFWEAGVAKRRQFAASYFYFSF